jgi:secondary thiamine-phosphate synthase enzyme
LATAAVALSNGTRARRKEEAAMDTIAYTEYLTLRTEKRYEIRDITDIVERVRATANLRDGYVLVSTMHITSSIFVNDHEPGLWSDILTWVERLAPAGQDYRHHQTGEDNGDAHLKRLLLGHQVLVPVTNATLDLGPWERVHYGEFDGQRPKRILFKALGIPVDARVTA